MFIAWMLFAIEVSALLFASAWFAERVLLAMRRPVRGVWVAAIVCANLLPILLSKIPVVFVPKRWTLAVPPESLMARMGMPLLFIWGTAVAIGLFICASAVWRMSRARPKWKTEHVDNTPVLVSHDIGPALVGVMQYSIVVPTWAYSLEENARRLLLAHEREHARKYDPLLLAGAALTVVVAPWNVFNWLFFRRLHLAVELDCDQRVLRAHPDARSYGALLLDVAERVLPSVMPAAAFVEHGASLETRLNAMTKPKKSFQSARIVGGVAASVLLAAAACIAPRPYAVIVVVPLTAGAPVLNPQAQNAPPVVQQYQAAKSSTSSTAHRAEISDDIKPVPPSARVIALDEAEAERLRSAVIAVASRTLGKWPRGDSALVLLSDDHGDIVKQSVIGLSHINPNTEATYVFPQIFMIPEIGALRGASVTSIDRGVANEKLDVPLKLYAGQLLAGAPAPLTRAEILPSRESMLEVLRANHPELLKDTAESSMIGALLYDSRGKLVKSAAVKMDFGPPRADGSQSSAEFEREALKKAFGSVMENRWVVESGMTILSNSPSFKVGPARMLYAVTVSKAEFDAFNAQMKPMMKSGMISGFSSRGGRPVDVQAISLRLGRLVQSIVPDAYGDWARGDSAVLLLFDANDQLIARRTSKIPDNARLLDLADLISKRVPGIPADDVEAVGVSMLATSPAGRVLDKPLGVVWGRLQWNAASHPNK